MENFSCNKKNSGYLVKVKSGKGIVYNKEDIINNKVVVHLVDNEYNPIIKKEKEVKILCDKKDLKIIGYVD